MAPASSSASALLSNRCDDSQACSYRADHVSNPVHNVQKRPSGCEAVWP